MKRFITLTDSVANIPYYIQVSQICAFGTDPESTPKVATIVKFAGNGFYCKETADEIMALIEED